MRCKKLVGILLAMALIGATTASLTACNLGSGTAASTPIDSNEPIDSGSTGGGTVDEPIDEVTISLPETASVAEFEQTTLIAVVDGEIDGEIVWTSSDATVATVNDGVVSGLKAGETTITAAIGDLSATCALTVTKTTKEHTLELSNDEIFMFIGESSEAITVEPKFDGEPLDIAVEYEWTKVEGDDVASVATEENGAKAVFTGTAAGEGVYEVSATVRGYKAYGEVTVTVRDNFYVAAIENAAFVNGENGYDLALTLGGDGAAVTIGDINITKNGIEELGVVSDLVWSWTSSDSTVADIDASGKVIEGKKAGTALLTGTATYEGKALELKVNVTVARGEVTLNDVITVETVSGKVAIPSEIVNTIEKITLSGSVVAEGEVVLDGGILTVEESKMPCKMSALGENKTMLVQTAEIVYIVPVNVYTMIIDTKDKLSNWLDKACDVAVNAGLCSSTDEGVVRRGEYVSGYFVLGADIDYNDNYVPKVTFGTHGNLYSWKKDWGADENFGFKGVFDGKGHNVYGMTVTGQYNGFVTTLSGGTIKNVSFIDAGVADGADFIAAAGSGTIENVYVKYKKITNSRSELVGTLYCNYIRTTRVTKNVVIDITDCEFDSSIQNTYIIGLDYGTFENIVLIGEVPSGASVMGNSESGENEDARFHATSYSDLFKNGATIVTALTSGDNAFFAKNENIFLPASEMAKHVSDVPALDGAENVIELESSITLIGTPYVTYALESAIDGVTLSGNVLSVAENAAADSEIVVIVTSLVSGNQSTFTFTVKAKSYVLGTQIDMSEVTLSNLSDFGLSSIWSQSIEDASIDGASGKVAKFRNNESGMNAHGADVALNTPITVINGLNYVKVRMYLDSTAIDSMEIRFYRSDRTNHQVETDVWMDASATIPANVWTNVYLDVSKFAVDGKITGFKFGVFTAGDATVYIDYISGEINCYTVGEVIDMNKTTLSNLSDFGLSSIWSQSIEDASIDGASGKVAKFRNNESGMNAHGADVALNTPITVIDGLNCIRIRMYLDSTAIDSMEIRFYRSDRMNHQVETDVWMDASTTLIANVWTDVYLDVSKFAVDGKITGFKFAVFTAGDATVYIDGISIELNAYTLGEEMDMDKVSIGGHSLSGISATWNNSIEDASIDGASGKVAKFTNNETTSIQYHGNTITFKNAITLGEGFNYIKIRMYIESDDTTTREVRFYRSDVTSHGDWFRSTSIEVNTWTDVYFVASDFAVDGKISGFKFANFTAGAGVVYIDSIAIVSTNPNA